MVEYEHRKRMILAKAMYFLNILNSDPRRQQKSLYLAQFAGIRLDYRFMWYMPGPYSPSLANDIGYIKDCPDLLQESYSLRFKDHREVVDRFLWLRHYLQQLNNDYIQAAASLAYIKRFGCEVRMHPVDRLLQIQPWWTEDRIDLELIDTFTNTIRGQS